MRESAHIYSVIDGQEKLVTSTRPSGKTCPVDSALFACLPPRKLKINGFCCCITYCSTQFSRHAAGHATLGISTEFPASRRWYFPRTLSPPAPSAPLSPALINSSRSIDSGKSTVEGSCVFPLEFRGSPGAPDASNVCSL